MESPALPMRHKYSLIVDADKDEEGTLSPQYKHISNTIRLSWNFLAFCVVVLAMAAAMGFFVGQSTRWIEPDHGLNCT